MTRVRRDGGARDATPTCPPEVPAAPGRVLPGAPLPDVPLLGAPSAGVPLPDVPSAGVPLARGLGAGVAG
ncbi:hypothetical protein [Micromonospora rubida]|uniref:hypothetical protein n=1 Tax=Micromonospora rubida TaxID=2697657 RepID=UPI0013773838|nr:hypothetical protein [Micromonospora rubida]NBE83822.1 hypothetical protein [Micromonospora rubida]